jgi:hypothetical protein
MLSNIHLGFKCYGVPLFCMTFSLAKIVQIIKGLQAFYPHFAVTNETQQTTYVSIVWYQQEAVR